MNNKRKPQSFLLMISLSGVLPFMAFGQNFPFKLQSQMLNGQKINLDFSYTRPQIALPQESGLDQTVKEKLGGWEKVQSACKNDYIKAREVLEESIADVSTIHPDALEIAKEANKRFWNILDKHAEIQVEQEFPDLPAHSPAKAAFKDLIINKTLSFYLGSTGHGGKSVFNSGYVGQNPLAIRKIFQDGNFRERLYVLFKGGNYLGDLFTDQKMVSKINEKFKLDPSIKWKLNQEAMNPDPQYDPYTLGSYLDYRARKDLPMEETLEYPKKNFPALHKYKPRIPFSEREQRLMKELKLGNATEDVVPWLPGASWMKALTLEEYKASKNPESLEEAIPEKKKVKEKNKEKEKKEEIDFTPYLEATSEIYAPQISSVSSTTDRLLTTAIYFNLNSPADLMKMRLAALASMVDAKDHSAHEILMASKSFKLPYQMTPDFYKQIYPLDPQFVSKLEEAQRKRGYFLPDSYLNENCALKTALKEILSLKLQKASQCKSKTTF